MRLGRLGAGDILFGWGKAVEKKAALPANRYAGRILSCFMHEIFVLFFFIASGFAASSPSVPAETVCQAGKACGLNIERQCRTVVSNGWTFSHTGEQNVFKL